MIKSTSNRIYLKKDFDRLIARWRGECQIVLAARFIDEDTHAFLVDADQYEVVDSMPWSLEPLYISRGVQYYGRM